MANDEIEALMQSAKAHHRSGEYDAAIADYTKAIGIAPNNIMKATVYLERGRMYKEKGHSGDFAAYDLAFADYNQAFSLEPNNEEIVRRVRAYSSAAFVSRGSKYLEKN